ncbi:CLUMA_CG018469, isoform A [Clunio marinus]|uniref:CLUMA_CG018469, isoform A n=1 Tax=Clunio marinus TaxID=568069 RepID=A0A1J1IZI5_9DIPT|nr:CLUMA_CG018469, isoform A [Clunio marinus]
MFRLCSFLTVKQIKLKKIAEGNQGAKIYWSSVTYTSNPTYFSDFSVIIFNDTDGETKSNATLTQIEDMEKFIITINSRKDMKDFNRELLRINADTCKLFKGTFKNAIVRNVFRDIREVSNLKFSCPQPKGEFYISELILPGSIPFIDKFLLNASNGNFEFTLLIRAKPFNKKIADGVSVKAYGVYEGNPERKIYWSSVTYTSNPMYVSGFGVIIFNDTDGDTKSNATLTQLEDMEKLLITIVLIQNSKKGMKDFNRELLRINADTCNQFKGTFKNAIVRNIFRDIREVSNIKFSCPQPKGIFYIRELVLPGSIPFMDKFIKYALEGDFEMTVLIRAKPFKKKLTNGVSVKAYGVFTYE